MSATVPEVKTLTKRVDPWREPAAVVFRALKQAGALPADVLVERTGLEGWVCRGAIVWMRSKGVIVFADWDPRLLQTVFYLG